MGKKVKIIIFLCGSTSLKLQTFFLEAEEEKNKLIIESWSP